MELVAVLCINSLHVDVWDELTAYLSTGIVDAAVDPLDWWKRYQSDYPSSACSARDYLSIRPSSAAIERLFSAANQIVTKERARLSAILQGVYCVYTRGTE
ncbi:hypothetical protein GEMRC1_000630 [Eukaryota sp. GEM-RC1]